MDTQTGIEFIIIMFGLLVVSYRVGNRVTRIEMKVEQLEKLVRRVLQRVGVDDSGKTLDD